MADATVVYRAVADFSALRREVAATRLLLKQQRDEQASGHADFMRQARDESRQRNAAIRDLKAQTDAFKDAARTTREYGAAVLAEAAANRRAQAEHAATTAHVNRVTAAYQRAAAGASDYASSSRDVERGSDRASRSVREVVDATRRVGSASREARSGVQGLQGGFAGLANSASRSVGSLIGMTTSFRGLRVIAYAFLTSAVQPLITGLGALGTAAYGVVGAFSQMSGAGLVLPAIFTGIGLSVGALMASLSGVGAVLQAYGKQQEAIKTATAKAAESQDKQNRAIQRAKEVVQDARRGMDEAVRRNARETEDAAERVSDAERNNQDALRDSKRAQEGVNEAREKALKDLKDLREAVDGAALSEERALVDLKRAREEYYAVIADPTSSEGDIADAALRVKEREQDLAGTRKDNKENLEKYNEAKKKGVEGSDRVVDALQREKDAQDRVSDSQRELKRAREDQSRVPEENAARLAEANRRLRDANLDLADAQADVAASAQAVTDAQTALDLLMSQLSPSAQRFVKGLVAMREEFQKMKKTVQEDFFSALLGQNGLESIRTLITSIGEALRPVARAFGDAAGQLLKFLATPEMAAFFRTMGESMGRVIEVLTPALINIFQAFANIAEAGAPFMERMARAMVRGSEAMLRFSQDTGRLNSSLERGFTRASQFYNIFKLLFGGIAAFGRIARPFFDWVVERITAAAERFRKFADEQERLGQSSAFAKYLRDVRPLLSEIAGFIGDLSGAFGRMFSRPENIENTIRMFQSLRDMIPALEAFFNQLGDTQIAPEFVEALTSVLEALTRLLETGGGGALSGFAKTLSGIAESFAWIVDKAPVLGWLFGAMLTSLGALAALRFVGLLGAVNALLRLAGVGGIIGRVVSNLARSNRTDDPRFGGEGWGRGGRANRERARQRDAAERARLDGNGNDKLRLDDSPPVKVRVMNSITLDDSPPIKVREIGDRDGDTGRVQRVRVVGGVPSARGGRGVQRVTWGPGPLPVYILGGGGPGGGGRDGRGGRGGGRGGAGGGRGGRGGRPVPVDLPDRTRRDRDGRRVPPPDADRGRPLGGDRGSARIGGIGRIAGGGVLGLVASLAAPAIGNALGGGAVGGTVSGALTGAAFGSMLGPIGAGIGGLVGGIYGLWASTGRKSIGGLWKGFKDKVKDFGRDVGGWITENVINPVKRVLGIRSPSTVFAKMGEMLIQGLIAGLMGGFGLIPGAIAGLFKVITGAFNFGVLRDTVVRGAKNVGKWFTDNLGGLASGARAKMGDAQRAIERARTGLSNTARSVASAAAGRFSSGLAAMRGFASSRIEDARLALARGRTRMENAARSVASGASSAFRGALEFASGIKDKIVAAAKRLRDNAGEFKDDAIGVGKKIKNWLVDGITGLGSALWKKISAGWEWAKGKVEDLIDTLTGGGDDNGGNQGGGNQGGGNQGGGKTITQKAAEAARRAAAAAAAAAKRAAQAVIPGWNSGGTVPGEGDSDTVPAMLTPGEFVIKKSAVKAIGLDALYELNSLNTGGAVARNQADVRDRMDRLSNRIQHFAYGGAVRSNAQSFINKWTTPEEQRAARIAYGTARRGEGDASLMDRLFWNAQNKQASAEFEKRAEAMYGPSHPEAKARKRASQARNARREKEWRERNLDQYGHDYGRQGIAVEGRLRPPMPYEQFKRKWDKRDQEERDRNANALLNREEDYREWQAERQHALASRRAKYTGLPAPVKSVPVRRSKPLDAISERETNPKVDPGEVRAYNAYQRAQFGSRTSTYKDYVPRKARQAPARRPAAQAQASSTARSRAAMERSMARTRKQLERARKQREVGATSMAQVRPRITAASRARHNAWKAEQRRRMAAKIHRHPVQRFARGGQVRAIRSERARGFREGTTGPSLSGLFRSLGRGLGRFGRRVKKALAPKPYRGRSSRSAVNDVRSARSRGFRDAVGMATGGEVQYFAQGGRVRGETELQARARALREGTGQSGTGRRRSVGGFFRGLGKALTSAGRRIKKALAPKPYRPPSVGPGNTGRAREFSDAFADRTGQRRRYALGGEVLPLDADGESLTGGVGDFFDGSGLGGGTQVVQMPALAQVTPNLTNTTSNTSSQTVNKGLTIQNLNIHNPLPERSSDSLPRRLRQMQYVGRLG